MPEDASPARKRPWFQFHLSTALLLVVGAGALLGANMQKSYCNPHGDHIDGFAYGWPAAAVIFVRGHHDLDPAERRSEPYHLFCDKPVWISLAVDVLIAAMVLASIAWASERFILRRAHKP
jgi:hypothetical protein